MKRWLAPAAVAAVVAFAGARALSADDAPPHAAIEPDVQDLLFLGPTRPVLVRLRITIDGQPFRALARQRFDELFAAADRDSDGRLDYDQVLSVVLDCDGGQGEPGAADLKQALADGTIDRRALSEYLERTVPPFVLRPRSVAGQGTALALFPLLDTDRDERLSDAELAAAERQLAERDFDDNGVITPFELIVDPAAIAAASDPAAGESALDPNAAPIMAITSATTPADVAKRLIKHYDHDGDGRLSTQAPLEIQLPAPLAGGIDVDGDARLSLAELSAAVAWPPDLELSFALGQAAVGAVRSRRVPASRDGFRVRRKLLGGYEVDLVEARLDFDRNNRDPRQADLVQMSSYDRDNNQYVDAAEAKAANLSDAAFAAMDVDGDGKAVKGELTTFMTRRNEAAAARLHLVIRDLGRDLFDRLDVDADGVLSPRDLRVARGVLDADDANADRLLGFDEVPLQLELELVRGVDEPGSADARVTRRVARPTTESEAAGPLWFRKLDRNNDGDLGPREFVGPRAVFDRLDADHDGLIDRAEAEAAAGK